MCENNNTQFEKIAQPRKKTPVYSISHYENLICKYLEHFI